MTFAETVKDYQTIIAASIALVGVITAMLYNASEARAQRFRERAHEAAVVRRALYSELRLRKEALENNLSKMRERPPLVGVHPHILVPTDFGPSIFGVVSERVGLLTIDEVEPVFLAFSVIAEFPRNVALLADTNQNEESRRLHLAVRSEQLPVIVEMTKDALERVSAAISALKAEMGPIERAT